MTFFNIRDYFIMVDHGNMVSQMRGSEVVQHTSSPAMPFGMSEETNCKKEVVLSLVPSKPVEYSFQQAGPSEPVQQKFWKLGNYSLPPVEITLES